jgi:hypothetical protein
LVEPAGTIREPEERRFVVHCSGCLVDIPDDGETFLCPKCQARVAEKFGVVAQSDRGGPSDEDFSDWVVPPPTTAMLKEELSEKDARITSLTVDLAVAKESLGFMSDANRDAVGRIASLTAELAESKQARDSALERAKAMDEKVAALTAELAAERGCVSKELSDWVKGDSGVSSMAIASALVPQLRALVLRSGPGVPADTGDFGRCHRLLQLIPDGASRMPEVAAAYPGWKPYVAVWDELTWLFESKASKLLNRRLDQIFENEAARKALEEKP